MGITYIAEMYWILKRFELPKDLKISPKEERRITPKVLASEHAHSNKKQASPNVLRLANEDNSDLYFTQSS